MERRWTYFQIPPLQTYSVSELKPKAAQENFPVLPKKEVKGMKEGDGRRWWEEPHCRKKKLINWS